MQKQKLSKTKLFRKIAISALFVLCLSASVAFGREKAKPVQLAPPQNLKITSDEIQWDEVENASYYTVNVQGFGKFETEETNCDLFDAVNCGVYTVYVKACGNENKYIDSIWSQKLNYELKATEGLEYVSVNNGTAYAVTTKNAYKNNLVKENDISGRVAIPAEVGGRPVT